MKTRVSVSVSLARQAQRYQELKRALEQRRRDIDHSVRGQLSTVREERAGTNTVGVLDEVEVADVDAQEDIELALIQIKLETIERIDEAIDRLKSGLYGHCIQCGDDISAVRLQALPFAVRCVGCEEAREAATRRERAASYRRMSPFADVSSRFQ